MNILVLCEKDVCDGIGSLLEGTDWIADTLHLEDESASSRLLKFSYDHFEIILVGRISLLVLGQIQGKFPRATILLVGPMGPSVAADLLNNGAGAIIPWPLPRRTLTALLNAVMREQNKEPIKHKALQCGKLNIDVSAYRAYFNGNEMSLSPTEFKLLVCLAENQERVVSHQELIRAGWGSGPASFNNREALKNYIKYLRLKLGQEDPKKGPLLAKRYIGYMLLPVP